jgi:hypothetical protein
MFHSPLSPGNHFHSRIYCVPKTAHQLTQSCLFAHLCSMQAFLNCANTQNDMSYCTAFNDQYKECKIQYGL